MNPIQKILNGIFPCVYLFTLGTVKNLKTFMNIDAKHNDEMLVCKYGKVDDLDVKTGKYIASYGLLKNSDLILKYCTFIDHKNILLAEIDINNFMNINSKVEYDNHKNIIVLDSKYLDEIVSKQYSVLTKLYSNSVSK